jgi:hypothetical protein
MVEMWDGQVAGNLTRAMLHRTNVGRQPSRMSPFFFIWDFFFPSDP